jgi:acetyl esterase/lipase
MERNGTVDRDLTYATVDGVDLRLDLYRAGAPAGTAAGGASPVVVYVHGGGWTHGDRTAEAETRLAPMAAQGVTVASIDYRLAPDAVFPAQLHDVEAAVRWLRATGPELGLQTDRIGVWGASAGAYLVSLLALSSPELVQAVVHWFGQADLAATAGRTDLEARLLPFHFEQDLLGPEPRTPAEALSLLDRIPARTAIVRDEERRDAGPADLPPFLIAHGDRDRIVPPAEGLALHDALVRAGHSSRFDLLGGAGHEDPAFDSPAHLATTAAWLRTVLS